MASFADSIPGTNIAPTQAFSPEEYLGTLYQYVIPETRSSKGEVNWGRLICTWREKKPDGTLLDHTYAACIDGRNHSWYLDDRPRKIFAKCVAQLFVRPFFTVAKTICFIIKFPLVGELKAYHSKEQSGRETALKIGRATANILLTPIFGVILTIMTLAVIILGVASPTSLYEGRKWIGRIEQLSNWGKTFEMADDRWLYRYRQHKIPTTLAPCFQEHPLEDLACYAGKGSYKNTDYTGMDAVERQLANFARGAIRAKRRGADRFEKRLKPDDVPYESPILKSLYANLPPTPPQEQEIDADAGN